MLKIRLYKFIN